MSEIAPEMEMSPSLKGKQLTLESRIQIVRLSSAYPKFRDFCLEWKDRFNTDPPCRKTVSGINKKFNETGSVTDFIRSGRPLTSRTPDKISRVENAIKNNPSQSLRSLAAELGMNRATIHRIKLGSRSKTNLMETENILRKEVAKLSKQLQVIKNKDPAGSNAAQRRKQLFLKKGSGSQTNLMETENVAELLQIQLMENEDQCSCKSEKKILEEEPKCNKRLQNSIVDKNQYLTVSSESPAPSVTKLTSHIETEVLHFPTGTYPIVEVRTAPESTQHMDVTQVETINNSSQDHAPKGWYAILPRQRPHGSCVRKGVRK